MGSGTAASVAIAEPMDIVNYVELAQAAQAYIRSKGLTQWVPAAHAPFLPNLQRKVGRQSLHRVLDAEEIVAFFDLSLEPSEWWAGRGEAAGYISGIVVARASRGRRLGDFILEYAETAVRETGAKYLRLDCHAENSWLCDYYRRRGFSEVGRLEQHPGYLGALYQKRIACLVNDPLTKCSDTF